MPKNVLQILAENKKNQDKILHLGRCQITDLPKAFLDLLHLEELDLSHNQLTDISMLQYLKNLRKINLSFNRIENISSLQYLGELIEINLEYNPILDFSNLSENNKLEILRINLDQGIIKKHLNPETPDFTFIRDLTQLKILTLQYCQIEHLSIFHTLRHLIHLNLNGNNIQDINFDLLNKFPNLSFLSIYENEVVTKKLMKPYYWDYFLSENMLDDIKKTLNSEWYKSRYHK